MMRPFKEMKDLHHVHIDSTLCENVAVNEIT